MDRRRVGFVVALLVVVSAAVAWFWRDRGAGEERAAPADAPPAPLAPEALAPRPLVPTAADVPPPAPRKRAPPRGIGSGSLSVVGRAVDDAGKPIAKPVVEVVVPDGIYADTVGDDDGRFSAAVFLMDGRGPLHAFVEARASDGRLARKEFVIRSDLRFDRSAWRQKEDVGDLVLRAPIGVDVLVVSPSGSPVAADVYALAPDSRWAVARAVSATGKDGRGRLLGLTPEPHRLVAVAAGFGRGTVTVTPGAEGGALVRIPLTAERRIDVFVIDDETKKPIVNAHVEVLGLADAEKAAGAAGIAYVVPPIADVTTDETGHATLAGLSARDDVAVFARDAVAANPRYDPSGSRAYGATLVTNGRPFAVVPQGETSITLTLSSKRTLEWPIEGGEVAVPADGTPIVIENPAGSGRPSSEIPREGRVERGHLVIDGCLTRGFYANVKTPDGAVAQVQAAPEQSLGAPIRFRRPRRVEVILRNPDGSPAVGLQVQFRQEGNNPVGPVMTTDAEGRAVLEGQLGGWRTAWLVSGNPGWEGLPLGSGRIEQGDARIEATIPAEREAILRLKADGAPLDIERVWLRVSGLPPTIVSRDASKSEVRFRWRPRSTDEPSAQSGAGGSVVQVDARGFLSDSAPIPEGEAPVVEITLHGSSSVSVVLVPPSQAYLIMLQRYEEKTRRWHTIAEASVGGQYAFEISAAGKGRIGTIEPGRYRWVDARSGTLSEPFDVAAGGSAERTLDLSKSAVVRGRVEVPAGEPLDRIGILRVGTDPDVPGWQMYSGQKSTAWTDAAGKFELRVPGDAPVRLSIERGRLAPAPDGGEVEVTGARDDVVLRAVLSPTATLRFDRDVPSSGIGSNSARVLGFRGEPLGEPEFSIGGTIEGPRLRFSGFVPGRYTLWIDAGSLAPTILRGVELKEGENDLGKATASDGTTVVLKILTKPGVTVAHLQFSGSPVVEPGGAPKYFRTTFAANNEARLRGLGAGRVYVSTFSPGLPRNLTKTLDVDGTGEVTVELDLR